LPSLDAVIVTGPPTTIPVTRPAADTDAVAEAVDVHWIARPVIGAPAASRSVAVN
jgi:hypothetical protein